MREFLKSTQFKIMCAAVAVILTVGIVVHVTGAASSPGDSALGFIITPIQSAVTSVSDKASSFFGVWSENEQLRAQVAQLQEQNRSLTSQLIDYDKVRQENDMYKSYLGIRSEHEDFTFEPAMVVSRDPSNRFGAFTINKGSAAGISLWDPVITADGLVGYICNVMPTSSVVRTVLDADISIAALDSRTRGDTGVVTGSISLSMEGCTAMNYLSRTSTVAIGDMIVTTGVGGVFPADILIGTVKNISKSDNEVSSYAVIEPAADIYNLSDVFVITGFDGQGGVMTEAVTENVTETATASSEN